MFVSPSIALSSSICLSFFISLYLSISLSVGLPKCRISIYLSIFLYIPLSTYTSLSIYIFSSCISSVFPIFLCLYLIRSYNAIYPSTFRDLSISYYFSIPLSHCLFLSLSISVCPSVSLSPISLYLPQFLCLICLSLYISVCPISFYPPLSLYLYLFICLPLTRSIHLSLYVPLLL